MFISGLNSEKKNRFGVMFSKVQNCWGIGCKSLSIRGVK